MPNLSDILLATVGLLITFFFLPMFALARTIADSIAGEGSSSTTAERPRSGAWRITLVISVVFVYLSYLVLAKGLVGLANDIVPPAVLPRYALGAGLMVGVLLYGALTARSTWTRRKRRAS